jgi:hypothetical protein
MFDPEERAHVPFLSSAMMRHSVVVLVKDGRRRSGGGDCGKTGQGDPRLDEYQ